MRGFQAQVLLGTRIPASLKKRLSNYCRIYGIKINYFITEAIKERLLKVAQKNRDFLIAKDRLKRPKYIPQKKSTSAHKKNA